MVERMAIGAGILAAMMEVAAQTQKPAGGAGAAGTKGVMNRITVRADAVYTGTMETQVQKGKVTGKMHITAPTEITGDVSGTSKDGVMTLEFPYHMIENKCDGTVKMNITMPAKPGPATGTMEAVGCGRDPSQKLMGTVELVPEQPAKK